jgi:hypothetical protein
MLTGQPFVSFATGSSGAAFALTTIAAIRFGRQVGEFRIAPLWLAVLLFVGITGRQDGLGMLLPISVLAANLPQVWTAYREADLAELSLGTWLLSMCDGLVWGTYSLLQHDISIMVFGALQLTTSGLIVALKLWHKTRQPDRALDQ